MAEHGTDAVAQDVFDIANWLEHVNTRVDAPVPRAAAEPTAPTPAYVPRHRDDVPADSVA